MSQSQLATYDKLVQDLRSAYEASRNFADSYSKQLAAYDRLQALAQDEQVQSAVS